MKISTDHLIYQLETFCKLTRKEQAKFPYLRYDKYFDPRFVKFRGRWIDLGLAEPNQHWKWTMIYYYPPFNTMGLLFHYVDSDHLPNAIKIAEFEL